MMLMQKRSPNWFNKTNGTFIKNIYRLAVLVNIACLSVWSNVRIIQAVIVEVTRLSVTDLGSVAMGTNSCLLSPS